MTNQGKQTIDQCNYHPPTECLKVMSTEGEGVFVAITYDALDALIRRIVLLIGFGLVFIFAGFSGWRHNFFQRVK